MNMTHYMELLAVNQPWNLILFMAIPIILAETVAITELYILYTRTYTGPVRTINRLASIIGGFYFLAIFLYLLFTAVVPMTRGGTWRGPADVIAVLAYLAGVVPLLGMALLDLKLLKPNLDDHARMGLHAALVALFLIVGHIAMIFGMLDPTVLGGAMQAGAHKH